MKKFLIIFLLATIFLCSCGEMRNISFSEMSEKMVDAAQRPLTDKSITSDDCYILGVSEKTYMDAIENAAIFAPDFSSDGFQMIIVKAKTSIDAERLCAEMKSNYEPAPCDPAENTELVYYRDYVLFAKGGTAETERLSSAFMSLLKRGSAA